MTPGQFEFWYEHTCRYYQYLWYEKAKCNSEEGGRDHVMATFQLNELLYGRSCDGHSGRAWF